MRHQNPSNSIENYINLSFNIKDSHPKILYYALPPLYALRGALYPFISNILIALKHHNFLSQKDILELFESFHNDYDVLFCNCVIYLRIR